MSNISNWNRNVFERARLRRQQEFDKILAQQTKEQEQCHPSLFTLSADSASSPSDSSKGQV